MKFFRRKTAEQYELESELQAWKLELSEAQENLDYLLDDSSDLVQDPDYSFRQQDIAYYKERIKQAKREIKNLKSKLRSDA